MEVNEEEITELFVGEMGIRSVYAGEEELYTRPGAYCYLELE